MFTVFTVFTVFTGKDIIYVSYSTPIESMTTRLLLEKREPLSTRMIQIFFF